MRPAGQKDDLRVVGADGTPSPRVRHDAEAAGATEAARMGSLMLLKEMRHE